MILWPLALSLSLEYGNMQRRISKLKTTVFWDIVLYGMQDTGRLFSASIIRTISKLEKAVTLKLMAAMICQYS
jgi:hypothetical protein